MNKDSYNYGFGILRIWMAYEVVLCHFWLYYDNPPSYQIFWTRFILIAVPVYMLMSFYLITPKLTSQDNTFIKSRLLRLVIPYITWAMVYFAFHIIVQSITGFHMYNGIEDLGWQLIGGSSFYVCHPMWYQAVLILLTITFFVIFRLLPTIWAIMISCILAIGSIFMQYSGINYALFGELRPELTYTLGRICEMIPYAVIGIMIGLAPIIRKSIQKPLIIKCLISMLAFILLSISLWHPAFPMTKENFSYAGVPYIITALCLFFLGLFLPLDMLPNIVKRSIRFVASYTFGIYCLHLGTGELMFVLLGRNDFHTHKMLFCLAIYLASFVIAVLISKIPHPFFKRLVQ